MSSYFLALAVMAAMAFVTWIYALFKRNVNSVDSLWALMFLAAAFVYTFTHPGFSWREGLVLTLVSVWALRLSGFLLLRNWGQPEDKRYQSIRANNSPFWIKSLIVVFGLQAVLAWLISLPLFVALQPATSFHWVDAGALILWMTGFTFEAISDWQLYRFKKNPQHEAAVLSTGLWAYSRHPNYFGEAMIWWSYFLYALPAGGWWTIYAPVLMTLLLIRVSGVRLMEQSIGARRPAYADYIRRTNAFFPGRSREHRT